jgi:tRNA A37 threonylcarbamoyladenosine dehydratase
MSENYIVPIVEIMRKANHTDNDKLMTIQLVTADKDHLHDEIRQVFGENGNKVIEKCDFVYSSKTEEYRKQIEEEKKKKALLERIWDRSSRIQCWSCGKVNDGNFWKHKYHSQREDEYCIGGFYGTCKTCDPSGTYQA